MQSNTHYYVTGNTAEGLVNFLPSNVDQIDHIITFTHPSNPLKTALLERIIQSFHADYELEIIHSASGSAFLDGVIIREKSLAFITDTIATTGAEDVEFDLKQYVPLSAGEDPTEDQNQMQQHTIAAYEDFATGLELHDDLEAIFIKEMDFKKADIITERFIIELLYKIAPIEKEVRKVQRLFGTNTPEGAVNTVPELIENVSYRYFLKGRAGTGKSTFMRKVAKACEDHGLDLEFYHCSFDPNSIDMVLVPELNFCIFDSTDPHEFFPERTGDVVIDLYEKTVTPGTDEKYEGDIQEVAQNYKSSMKRGMRSLKKARSYQYQCEQKYPFDVKVIDDIFEKLMNHINVGK